MICSAKPVLTEDYVCNANARHDERPNTFIRDKPIFLSERLLLKDYYRKGSDGGKKFLVVGVKVLDAKTNRLAINRQ
jgi:hypothetical protein